MKTIAVAVVESSGRFLVGERPEGVALAGYAEFPGGKVELGEQPRQAAIRECHEETGLEIRVTQLMCETVHDYDHGRVCIFFFLCKLAADGVPAHPFRWVDGKDLAGLKFPPANAELLQLLLAR